MENRKEAKQKFYVTASFKKSLNTVNIIWSFIHVGLQKGLFSCVLLEKFLNLLCSLVSINLNGFSTHEEVLLQLCFYHLNYSRAFNIMVFLTFIMVLKIQQ